MGDYSRGGDSTAVILRKMTRKASEEADRQTFTPFGGLSKEELLRRSQEGKTRRKLLRDVAQQIGGQYVCEYVDDFGVCHSFTRDELIVQKFAEELTKKPTAARILAWQRLKGEDVQQIARVDTVSGKSTDELRAELNNLLSVINSTGSGQQMAANIQQHQQQQRQDTDTPPQADSKTATDTDTGEHIEVVEAEELPPVNTPRRLPWLG